MSRVFVDGICRWTRVQESLCTVCRLIAYRLRESVNANSSITTATQNLKQDAWIYYATDEDLTAYAYNPYYGAPAGQSCQGLGEGAVFRKEPEIYRRTTPVGDRLREEDDARPCGYDEKKGRNVCYDHSIL